MKRFAHSPSGPSVQGVGGKGVITHREHQAPYAFAAHFVAPSSMVCPYERSPVSPGTGQGSCVDSQWSLMKLRTPDWLGVVIYLLFHIRECIAHLCNSSHGDNHLVWQDRSPADAQEQIHHATQCFSLSIHLDLSSVQT